MREEKIVLRAEFDPKLKLYWWLQWAGLATLKVETAGASTPQGQEDAGLAGIVDALTFRDAVLDQRDRLLGYADSSAGPEAATARGATPTAGSDDGVLIEIRDSLRRIEGLLEKRRSGEAAAELTGD